MTWREKDSESVPRVARPGSLHAQRYGPHPVFARDQRELESMDSGEYKTRTERRRIVVGGSSENGPAPSRSAPSSKATGELRYREFQPNGSDAKIRTAEIHAISILTLDRAEKPNTKAKLQLRNRRPMTIPLLIRRERTTAGRRPAPVLPLREARAYLAGREPVMRISTSLVALCCQSGLVATLATPISARSRSIGSRSLRMSPLFIARFTSARIASQIRS
jgi:hypothetical protein